MPQSELAFCTTTELIEELVRRKTFLGVVVHAETEHRDHTWKGDKVFQVRFNANLDSGEACRLLEVVTAHLDRPEA
jgi:hypothetical protein